MAIKLPPLPAPNERLVVQDGMINPVWYQWLVALQKLLREADLNTLQGYDPAAITNGWTIRWDSTLQRWVPGL